MRFNFKFTVLATATFKTSAKAEIQCKTQNKRLSWGIFNARIQNTAFPVILFFNLFVSGWSTLSNTEQFPWLGALTGKLINLHVLCCIPMLSSYSDKVCLHNLPRLPIRGYWHAIATWEGSSSSYITAVDQACTMRGQQRRHSKSCLLNTIKLLHSHK